MPSFEYRSRNLGTVSRENRGILTKEEIKMKVKLLTHNSIDQKNFGGCDDTREHLKLGEIYEAIVKVHTWHTKYIINGKKFNSVCFEDSENY